ncbi:hypothetical protein [Streptomyces sp. NPDC056227]|uniref:hypothetical protein n=1 Tax=Streptomyces sp. NPDC056227 TaxID=3345753 RepID=UPI0035DBAE4C
MTTQTETAAPTADMILARYASDVADLAEEQPATTLAELANQLRTAAENLEGTDINGGDELETAAQYLTDGNAATDDNTRTVLLGKAAEYLTDVYGMANDYRDAS